MKTNNTNPVGTELVKAYLLKHPELPSRTIARHLFDDPKNKGVWNSLQTVRSSVCYYRGAIGTIHRARALKTGMLLAPPIAALALGQGHQGKSVLLPSLGFGRVEAARHPAVVRRPDAGVM